MSVRRCCGRDLGSVVEVGGIMADEAEVLWVKYDRWECWRSARRGWSALGDMTVYICGICRNNGQA